MFIFCSFQLVLLVVKDKLVSNYLTKLVRSVDERVIMVATMLRAKRSVGKFMCHFIHCVLLYQSIELSNM